MKRFKIKYYSDTGCEKPNKVQRSVIVRAKSKDEAIAGFSKWAKTRPNIIQMLNAVEIVRPVLHIHGAISRGNYGKRN